MAEARAAMDLLEERKNGSAASVLAGALLRRRHGRTGFWGGAGPG